MKEILLVMLYPVVMLVLILAWFWLMHHSRSSTRVTIKGLGLSIDVSSTRSTDLVPPDVIK